MPDIPFAWRILALLVFSGIAVSLDLLRPAAERHRWREYSFLLCGTALGVGVGMAFDAVTSTISPDYFEHGKGIAPGPGFQRDVLSLGAEAGSSAGVIAAAVLLVANRRADQALGLFRVVWMPAAGAALFGTACALVQWQFAVLNVENLRSLLAEPAAIRFEIVWATHGGFYIGAVVGLIIATVAVRRRRAAAERPAPQPTTMDFEARWAELLGRLGLAPSPVVLAELLDGYGQPDRAYHGLHHLEFCLEELDRHRPETEDPDLLELALWYHDLIYDTKSPNNEQRSADRAGERLHSLGLPAAPIERVQQLIMLTVHPSDPGDFDGRLVVDIDLAILGAEDREYRDYVRRVRSEYYWVPRLVFDEKRASFLTSVLASQRVFKTAAYFASHEERARANVTTELNELRHSLEPMDR